MKILHVLETLSPRYGGPVSVLLALASAQQRAGHEVTIATTTRIMRAASITSRAGTPWLAAPNPDRAVEPFASHPQMGDHSRRNLNHHLTGQRVLLILDPRSLHG